MTRFFARPTNRRGRRITQRSFRFESLESRQVLSAAGWSEAIGDVDDDAAFDVASDDAGNAYVGGYVNGQDGYAGSQLFLAKYNSAGIEQWNQTGTSRNGGNSGITNVAVDSVGNSYVTGWFLGELDFSAGVTRTADATDGSEYDGFLAKYDASGVIQWVHQLSDYPWYDSDLAIREDPINGTHIYLTGDNADSLTYDQAVVVPNTLGHTAAYLMVVVDTGDRGIVSWARQVQEAGRIRPGGLTVNSSGDIYLVGEFNEGGDKPKDDYATASIVEGELMTSVGWYDPFVAMFSAQGEAVWSLPLGGSGDMESGVAVDVDSQGNVYVTGTYWRGAEIGGVTLEVAQHRTTYIAKLTETGSGPAVSWVKNLGGNEGGFSEAYSLVVDESNGSGSTSVYLAGLFTGVLDFDPDFNQEYLVATTTPQKSGSSFYDTGDQGFLLQISDQGSFENVWQFGRVANGMALSSDGSVFVAGRYEADSSAMVTRNLDPAGGKDAFLIRVDPEAPVVALTPDGDFTEGEPTTVTASAFDRVDGDLSGLVDWALNGVHYDSGLATIELPGLSVGRHTLMASVTDSDGVTGSYLLTFFVNPAAPTNLIAAAIDGSSVTLNWTDQSAGETGFVIERALRPKGKAAPVWEQVGETDANTTAYTNTEVPSGTYVYRVRSIFVTTNAVLSSEWAATLEVSLSGDGGAKGGGKPNR